MIKRLVASALRVPGFVLLATAILVLGGLLAFSKLQIEAYPNPVPPLVETIVQPTGWSPEEVERYVTIPLEVGLAGMAGLEHILLLVAVRAVRYQARYSQLGYRLLGRAPGGHQSPAACAPYPTTLQAQISPWNGVGEVFRYFVKGKGYTLKDLKAVEDFTLERQWRQVPGVIDVTSFGGETKEYHVEVDPYRMRARGVSLNQLQTALANANANTGGSYMPLAEQSFNVRGIGLISSLKDIGDVMVEEGTDKAGNPTGTPTRVRDIANVTIDHAPRLGVIGTSARLPIAAVYTGSWWQRLWETEAGDRAA